MGANKECNATSHQPEDGTGLPGAEEGEEEGERVGGLPEVAHQLGEVLRRVRVPRQLLHPDHLPRGE